MTNYIILFLCILIILAYLFDITSKYSKIPGVILLIALGILIQQIVSFTSLEVPNMKPYLPVLGTLGLILIVLEASLELKLERGKSGLIMKSVSAAIFLFVFFVAFLTLVMVTVFRIPPVSSLLTSIPLGVISSAVAISSAGNLMPSQKEFIVYESSLSDIIGILFFDFILIYGDSPGKGVFYFTINGLITIIIALVVTALLAILLHKTNYHVNYVIILTFVILTYVLAKLIHLPALLLIFIFGLVLSNNRYLENDFMTSYVDFSKFRNDIDAFKKILGELTFIIRSFFFIMFGFYASLEGFANVLNILTAMVIVGIIFLFRWLYFVIILRITATPLVFFSPRGLITILLFLSIPEGFRIGFISEEVVIMVILLTIIILAIGNVLYRREIPESHVKANEITEL